MKGIWEMSIIHSRAETMRAMRWLLVAMATTALYAGSATMAPAGELAGNSSATKPCFGNAETGQAGSAEKTPSGWLREIRLGILTHDVDGL